MRSGTTSLARYVGAHPAVYLAPQKELRFFDRNFDLGLEHYRREFAGAADDQIAGEATQTYLYDVDALDRIAQTVPSARLLAILRNPVDRAHSHYWQNRALGKEGLSFAEAVAAEPERLRAADLDLRFRYSYLDRGRYVEQLRRVVERFPRTALHVLLFEDLRDTPAESYRAVCRFLEIDDRVQPPNVGDVINSHVTFRSRRARRVSRRLPSPLQKIVGRLNARRDEYAPMDPEVRADLLEHFAPVNAELAEWLGRDLAAWDR